MGETNRPIRGKVKSVVPNPPQQLQADGLNERGDPRAQDSAETLRQGPVGAATHRPSCTCNALVALHEIASLYEARAMELELDVARYRRAMWIVGGLGLASMVEMVMMAMK